MWAVENGDNQDSFSLFTKKHLPTDRSVIRALKNSIVLYTVHNVNDVLTKIYSNEFAIQCIQNIEITKQSVLVKKQ